MKILETWRISDPNHIWTQECNWITLKTIISVATIMMEPHRTQTGCKICDAIALYTRHLLYKPTDRSMDIVVPAARDSWKFKKGKSTNGVSSKDWNFNDPELQRKKRVASYKAYNVEDKVKSSSKKSFRWIKERCYLMLYGYRR